MAEFVKRVYRTQNDSSLLEERSLRNEAGEGSSGVLFGIRDSEEFVVV
jgi:hypothetical protein